MLKTTQPTHPTTPTLVVSRPGIMRQSLRAALSVYPWIALMASVGDGLTALNYTVQHQPGLLVIDCNLLEEEVEALLAAVKIRAPETRCLVCTRSRPAAERLLTAGADEVILRDSSVHELETALLRLTQEEVDQQF
ncbi:MAG: response regulator transcription factor [Anaerolineae bacterium]|nr:response regulator transcription factor [Anaerolineae bacterium]